MPDIQLFTASSRTERTPGADFMGEAEAQLGPFEVEVLDYDAGIVSGNVTALWSAQSLGNVFEPQWWVRPVQRYETATVYVFSAGAQGRQPNQARRPSVGGNGGSRHIWTGPAEKLRSEELILVGPGGGKDHLDVFTDGSAAGDSFMSRRGQQDGELNDRTIIALAPTGTWQGLAFVGGAPTGDVTPVPWTTGPYGALGGYLREPGRGEGGSPGRRPSGSILASPPEDGLYGRGGGGGDAWPSGNAQLGGATPTSPDYPYSNSGDFYEGRRGKGGQGAAGQAEDGSGDPAEEGQFPGGGGGGGGGIEATTGEGRPPGPGGHGAVLVILEGEIDGDWPEDPEPPEPEPPGSTPGWYVGRIPFGGGTPTGGES